MSENLKQQLKNVTVGNLKRRHRKYAVWPIEKKIEVVTKYLVLGNLKLVAADTGVDYGVIRQWRIQPWWKELEQEVRVSQNISLDTKLSKIIERSLEATMDRLENGDVILNNKTGEFVRKAVSMRDAAKVATDLMARQQILRKAEEATTTVSEATVTEQLKALAAEFAKWQTTQKAKEEAVDVDVKEVESTPETEEESDSDISTETLENPIEDSGQETDSLPEN